MYGVEAMLQAIFKNIDSSRDYLIDVQRALVSIPALSPQNNGQGEKEKASWLKKHLEELGFQDIREFRAPDTEAPCGYRPNLVALLPGKDTQRTFWIISHIDVVPPGDLSLWTSDPYTLQVTGDTLTGRGVEDNHQGLLSSLLVAKALLENALPPTVNLGLLLVADEETGSHFGLEYITENHFDLFAEQDLVLVPDYGSPTGDEIEIAEKSMCWLKITVLGQQCHASTPQQGNNSLTAAADFILKLRKLYEIYNRENQLFTPPYSTFEATKKEANVENVNTIPGKDIFYLDCRVLPEYNLHEVLEQMASMSLEIEKKWDVHISIEPIQFEQAAPATPLDAPIVTAMMQAVHAVYQNTPRPVGIGGGTVAALLRKKGLPAVVWSCLEHTAHQPNEQSSITRTINDAKVMASALMHA